MSWVLLLAIVALALAALPAVMFFVNLAHFRRAPGVEVPEGENVPGVPGRKAHCAACAEYPQLRLPTRSVRALRRGAVQGAVATEAQLRVPPSSSAGTAATRSQSARGVSILIPARDEQRTIRACVEAALASRGVELEVIVLDDHSRDDTAGIVKALAAQDDRVRLEAAPPLPAGWCGKQHACPVLSKLARHDLLLFIDADVRLSPDAAARGVAFLEQSGAALVSGFPRQETGSLLEKMLLPLIHVVLLGYLPLGMMRRQPTDTSFGAGCGQIFLARRAEYERVGGHGAVRRSLHDGITLPRAFRSAGFATDLFDATDVATCRMYHGARACCEGLAKNATERMASPRAITPWTVLLLGGHVLGPALLIAMLAAVWAGWAEAAGVGAGALVCAGVATMLLYAMRVAGAVRFGHSIGGVMLHPIGVALLTAVQWAALLRHLRGRPAGWKGRVYGAPVAE